MLASFWREPPESRIVHLKGPEGPNRSTPKFDNILVVDDIQRYTQAALEALRQFYSDADLTVHLCHTYAAALAAFEQHDIKLVILDLDLNDFQGDGAILLKAFLMQKPEVTVLANSSRRKYNDILMEGGASAVLAKSTKNLRQWLAENG